MSVCNALKSLDLTRSNFFKHVASNAKTEKFSPCDEIHTLFSRHSAFYGTESLIHGRFGREVVILLSAQLAVLFRQVLESLNVPGVSLPRFCKRRNTELEHILFASMNSLGVSEPLEVLYASCLASSAPAPRFNAVGQGVFGKIMEMVGPSVSVACVNRWFFINQKYSVFRHYRGKETIFIDAGKFPKGRPCASFELIHGRNQCFTALPNENVVPGSHPRVFSEVWIRVPCKGCHCCEVLMGTYKWSVKVDVNGPVQISPTTLCRVTNRQEITVTPRRGTSRVDLCFHGPPFTINLKQPKRKFNVVIGKGAKTVVLSDYRTGVLWASDPQSVESFAVHSEKQFNFKMSFPNLKRFYFKNTGNGPCRFLDKSRVLPNLESLCVSSLNDLTIDDLREFNEVAPNLKYLGLIPLHFCCDANKRDTGFDTDKASSLIDMFARLEMICFQKLDCHKDIFNEPRDWCSHISVKTRVYMTSIPVVKGIMSDFDSFVESKPVSIRCLKFKKLNKKSRRKPIVIYATAFCDDGIEGKVADPVHQATSKSIVKAQKEFMFGQGFRRMTDEFTDEATDPVVDVFRPGEDDVFVYKRSFVNQRMKIPVQYGTVPRGVYLKATDDGDDDALSHVRRAFAGEQTVFCQENARVFQRVWLDFSYAFWGENESRFIQKVEIENTVS